MSHVMITGANRGIGLALVQQYLTNGWQVSATYRLASSAQELLELTEQYPNLTLYCIDITDYDEIASSVCEIDPIDVLINNAGYYGPKGYGFGKTDVNEWRKALEVNTIAPLKLVELLHEKLENTSGKTIVCISSKVGSMTENTSGGGYIYRSSKAALNSVVKSLHNDLSEQGYKVAALHPGWVQTEMGGPNALISTDESAKALFKLISTLTPQQSGRFINYDGNELPW
ncbi:SDR family oxidoreductase [Vibrio tapetis]|uniref:Short-chain dehydrogenase/reductase SDR n=1 Tax=Vibrio tapetis subsp. tapetis TaxID=1671868 RepID=A0A2N8ZDU5_9VIBR|nr:SDR family oxidoreductase [Vibrio tapetis]SON50063.1 Short-chain dehydrogenase/reductase SDR [Vibrio tapetis subsp. tapetis]